MVLIAALTLLMIMPFLHAQSDFVAPPLQNAVTLDGRYSSPTEWSDASELKIETGALGVGAYFSAKYDSNYLYTMWDFVEATKSFSGNTTVPYPNQMYAYVNPTGEDTTTVDKTMYRIFMFNGRLSATLSQGTPTGDWTEDTAAPGDIQSRQQFTSSPHSSMTHMVVELRIALTFGGIKSHMNGGIGLAIGFYDGSKDISYDYPGDWHSKNPSTWGTLEFSTEPIPEFPTALLPVLAVLVLIFVITKKRGWQMPTKV